MRTAVRILKHKIQFLRAAICPICGENCALFIIVSSEVKRAEPESEHSARRFCGQRFVGLGFGLLVFILFSGNGGVVFESPL